MIAVRHFSPHLRLSMRLLSPGPGIIKWQVISFVAVLCCRFGAREVDSNMYGSVSQGVSLHMYSETLVLHLKFVTADMHFRITQFIRRFYEVVTLRTFLAVSLPVLINALCREGNVCCERWWEKV